MADTATVIAGQRPTGSVAPDGTHRWATRSFADGTYTYTTFDGWLIDSETRTNDANLAIVIEHAIVDRLAQEIAR